MSFKHVLQGHMGLFEWLWSLLPDKCSIPDRHTYITCCRQGVRGNENLIPVGNEVWIMCDYCTVAWRDKLKHK